jgi:uncharacterized protein YndB with AHSA1/START domain
MINKPLPFAKAAMLIRKPISIVFNAFIDPEITTKIWFTKSSGKLDVGETISWTWEMFNHTIEIMVKSIIPEERIQIQWGENKNALVIWDFKKMNESETFVTITNTGFIGSSEDLIAQIRDATEGFTLVLANLKALLEHGILLDLVNDRYPKD